MTYNVPILLTWLRIAAIPVLIAVFYVPGDWSESVGRNLLATVIFVLAAITDWLDGYLARRLGQTSAFGAFLDPVADKLMVAAALILLVDLERTNTVIATVIIGREIAISALREWMAQLGESKNVAVSFIGKLKTTAQMIAIPMLLFHQKLWGYDVALIGEWLLVVAAVLTLWSMGYYLKMAWPQLVKRM